MMSGNIGTTCRRVDLYCRTPSTSVRGIKWVCFALLASPVVRPALLPRPSVRAARAVSAPRDEAGDGPDGRRDRPRVGALLGARDPRAAEHRARAPPALLARHAQPRRPSLPPDDRRRDDGGAAAAGRDDSETTNRRQQRCHREDAHATRRRDDEKDSRRRHAAATTAAPPPERGRRDRSPARSGSCRRSRSDRSLLEDSLPTPAPPPRRGSRISRRRRY